MSGVDGLIATSREKNKKLAPGVATCHCFSLPGAANSAAAGPGDAEWQRKESIMRTLRNSLAASLMVLTLGACADMSTRDRNTAIGAATGAVAGAALTGGDALGTLGGAAIGGFIGNQADGRHRR